jgi:hypothetical protein
MTTCTPPVRQRSARSRFMATPSLARWKHRSRLSGGGAQPAGSTAQVGVINDRRLLVTLKTDQDPGTVYVISLRGGATTGAAPTAVSAPPGTLTPPSAFPFTGTAQPESRWRIPARTACSETVRSRPWSRQGRRRHARRRG